jgi:hypothetical protein
LLTARSGFSKDLSLTDCTGKRVVQLELRTPSGSLSKIAIRSDALGSGIPTSAALQHPVDRYLREAGVLLHLYLMRILE